MIKNIFKKIFSRKKSDTQYIYSILGIKLKFKRHKYIKKMNILKLEKEIKVLKETVHNLTVSNKELQQKNTLLDKKVFKGFCWTNRKNFTTEEKIRLFSQWFYKSVGYYPDFKKPRSLNEKFNWLKFNYRNQEKGFASDKYLFKQYIKEKLGDGYTVPLIKVYDDINDINFDELPEKFVMKTTRGVGGKQVKIILDKSKVDLDALKYEFSCFLDPWFKGGIFTGFFGDKDPQKIVVEDYIEQISGQLYDYKFFCFHGEPKCIFVVIDRFSGKKTAIYDTEWNLLPVSRGKQMPDYAISKPKMFDKMMEISRKLSAPFPFVRVDFYEVEDKVLVGELTFTSGTGFVDYRPREWDYKFGEWLDLSKISEEHLQIMPEFVEGAKTFLNPAVVDRRTIKK